MTLGQKLKALLKDNSMTQEEFSRKIGGIPTGSRKMGK